MMAGFLEDNTKPDHVWTLWNNLVGNREPRLVRAVGPRPRHRPRHRRRATRSSSTSRSSAARASPRRPRASSTATSRACRPPRRRPTSTRRSSCSPTTAATARSRRGRRPTSSALRTDAARRRPTSTTAATTAPARAPATASGPSRRRSRTTVHLAGAPTIDLELTTSAPDAEPRRQRLRRRAGRDGDAGQPRRLPRPRQRPATRFELYAEDWRFEAGHRIGVLITDANDEWFDHEPSDAEVEVDVGEHRAAVPARAARQRPRRQARAEAARLPRGGAVPGRRRDDRRAHRADRRCRRPRPPHDRPTEHDPGRRDGGAAALRRAATVAPSAARPGRAEHEHARRRPRPRRLTVRLPPAARARGGVRRIVRLGPRPGGDDRQRPPAARRPHDQARRAWPRPAAATR